MGVIWQAQLDQGDQGERRRLYIKRLFDFDFWSRKLIQCQCTRSIQKQWWVKFRPNGQKYALDKWNEKMDWQTNHCRATNYNCQKRKKISICPEGYINYTAPYIFFRGGGDLSYQNTRRQKEKGAIPLLLMKLC